MQRGRSNTSGIIELLVGAPRGINTMRLFLFGAMLAFVLMITAIGLHSLLRNGGWLRERSTACVRPSLNAERWDRRTSARCASTGVSAVLMMKD